MTSRNYQVVRMWHNTNHKKIMKTGLTEAEALAWCRDPETSGSTCSDLSKRGRWFDGLEEMRLKTDNRSVHQRLREQKLKKYLRG